MGDQEIAQSMTASCCCLLACSLYSNHRLASNGASVIGTKSDTGPVRAVVCQGTQVRENWRWASWTNGWTHAQRWNNMETLFRAVLLFWFTWKKPAVCTRVVIHVEMHVLSCSLFPGVENMIVLTEFVANCCDYWPGVMPSIHISKTLSKSFLTHTLTLLHPFVFESGSEICPGSGRLHCNMIALRIKMLHYYSVRTMLWVIELKKARK